MPKIDYALIADALKFYKERGYEYIDVPWSASRSVVELTAPNKVDLYPYKDEYLVASGEQSFMQMLRDSLLEKRKKYMCVTPCFRDEKEYNEFTLPYFVKLELIMTGPVLPKDVATVLYDAVCFFDRYFKNCTSLLSTREGTDIMYNGVELGSYGLREHADMGSWVYGTGVAEPRLSTVLSKLPKGYSLANIPKGEFGEVSKIMEEVEELEDALEQKADIMALVELSDLYGAIEGFLKKYFPHTDMRDLERMSKITGRAFENGHRT